MIKYFKTNAFLVEGDTGLITHEDQEVNGLKIAYLFDHEDYKYLQVEGEEASIAGWVSRVSGVEVAESVVNDIQASLPVQEPILPQ
jgi:hypothetical protein